MLFDVDTNVAMIIQLISLNNMKVSLDKLINFTMIFITISSIEVSRIPLAILTFLDIYALTFIFLFGL